MGVFCLIQARDSSFSFFKVASLVDNPDLLKPENRETLNKLYPSDAIERAELLLKHIGSVGAYSHSQGIPHIRENVAKALERRDGYPANPDHIYLTQGASSGVQNVLQLLTQNSNSGFMMYVLYDGHMYMDQC